MKTDSQTTSITLDAVQSNLEQMLVFIDDHGSTAGLTDQERYDVQLGCEEVLVNIIHYAYPGTIGQINITCHTDMNGFRFTIIITDGGNKFNPLSVAEPDITASFEERTIGGLGIYLVRRMFDSLEYEYTENSNILKLYKK